MASLRIAACQLNLRVGDLSGNKEQILYAYSNAQDKGSDIAVFTELAVCGYPPEDLLLKRGFVHDTQEMLKEIASCTSDCVAVLGFVDGQAAAADHQKDHHLYVKGTPEELGKAHKQKSRCDDSEQDLQEGPPSPTSNSLRQLIEG